MAEAPEDEVKQVQLWVYDLSMGMARALSPMLLGQLVEGVWHTSVVVDNTEWVFGFGVHKAEPGTTLFGQPLQRVDLGGTQLPKDMIRELIRGLAQTRFRPEDYSLLHNNCNHFSNEVSLLLTGAGIPAHYLTQHEVLLSSPMGAMLLPMLQQMEAPLSQVTADGPAFDTSPSAPTAATGMTTTTTMTTTTMPTAAAANQDTAASATLTSTVVVDAHGHAVAASAAATSHPAGSSSNPADTVQLAALTLGDTSALPSAPQLGAPQAGAGPHSSSSAINPLISGARLPGPAAVPGATLHGAGTAVANGSVVETGGSTAGGPKAPLFTLE